MRILLVDQDPDLLRLQKLALTQIPSVTVVDAHSISDAIHEVRSGVPLACIIADAQVSGASVSELLTVLQTVEPRPAFVLCSVTPLAQIPALSNFEIDAHLPKTDLAQKLAPLVRSLLKALPPAPDQRKSDYVPLPVHLVSRLDRLPTDIYIHLSHRYVHVFRKDDTLQPDELKKYSTRGLEELHIRLEDLESFTHAFVRNHLADMNLQTPLLASGIREVANRTKDQDKKTILEELASTVENSKQVGLGVGEVLKFTETAYPKIQKALGQLAIKPEIESAIRATVALTVESVRWNRNLESLFEQTLGRQERSCGLHATLVAHVACRIAHRMGWKSASTRHKLCLAAFLHDITLTSDRLSDFQSYDDFLAEAGSLSAEEKAAFESHPEEAAKIALQMELPPPDVETILRQHHESPAGGGMPENIGYQQFHPLAAVFVLAEDWVMASETETLADFAKHNAAHYDYPLFRELLRKLRE
jgi:HD-GYP domain-containing protein (c-di-GMP phosphodiesterase class II)